MCFIFINICYIKSTYNIELQLLLVATPNTDFPQLQELVALRVAEGRPMLVFYEQYKFLVRLLYSSIGVAFFNYSRCSV